jgi:hypothetical protein
MRIQIEEIPNFYAYPHHGLDRGFLRWRVATKSHPAWKGVFTLITLKRGVSGVGATLLSHTPIHPDHISIFTPNQCSFSYSTL